MPRIPQIGERWQYLDEFILEITSINNDWNCKHFEGAIVQILPGVYKKLWPTVWMVSGKSGGYVEYMENWTFLEGQHKPTD